MPERKSRFKPTNQQVELVIGLAGPVGTDFDFVAATLTDALKSVSYSASIIKLSRFLREYELRDGLLPLDLESDHEDVRIREHQKAGNALREALSDNAALAIRAIRAIAEDHLATEERERSRYKAPRRHAYILDSLKRPEEVHQLRQIYGAGFFLIGVVSPRSSRIQRLASIIAKSHGSAEANEWITSATNLVDIDEGEDLEFGQNLSDTFPLADLFVAFGADAEKSRNDVQAQIRRFVRIIMGANDTTPTAEESAMFHAFGASVRSGSLARQVGASLANMRGDILSVGCNDVPRASGGIYWETDHYDHRDIKKQRDSSQEQEETIVSEIVEAFDKSGWFPNKPSVKEAIASLDKARVVNLLEFMRATHAEMDALLTAQRSGLSAQHATLYCTTFPCHECAKLIVGAGVSRVVYIEPYPKSRVAEMYKTEIAMERCEALCNSCECASTKSDICSSCGSKDVTKLKAGSCVDCGGLHRVEFHPFVGIGPRRYLEFFLMTSMEGLKFRRKDKAGYRLPWTPAQRSPMFPLSYLEKETSLYDEFGKAFEKLRKKEQP